MVTNTLKIKQILVVRETRAGESRVALTPEAVIHLKSPHYEIWVESGAGLKSGFSDDDYMKAGAKIFHLSEKGYPSKSLILRVKRAERPREHLENKLFHSDTCMMGFLDPFDTDDHVSGWKNAGITTFSLDEFKSLSVDDPRNMQAAMSRIAGRLALQDALRHVVNEQNQKLTLIGTGPAALHAALEAKKNKMPVQVFGRQEKYRNYFEALEARYHVMPDNIDQVTFIQKYLSNQTIVICAAKSAGKKAPLLLDEKSLKILPKGAVIIDLAVNEGGSVVGSQSDQIVISHGISLVHVSGYPKLEPKIASEAFAQCLMNLLLMGILSPAGEIFLDHELLKESWVTQQGHLNPAIALS